MRKPAEIHLLREGFNGFAQALTPEEITFIGQDLTCDEEPAAELFVTGKTSSTFDVVWQLIAENKLPEWGGVLALSQLSGRGQVRRVWFSPQGNLHVSFRLPAGDVFAGSEATVLLGLLFCEAFDRLGLSLKLKWPNDLVLCEENSCGKIGGILLEEKNDFLVAGVGINSAYLPAPDKLRSGAALQPAVLPDYFAFHTPISLWLRLVQSLILRYGETFMAKSRSTLLSRAEERLLWRGSEVLVSGESGGEQPFYGIVTGLSQQGGLVLLTKGANGMPKNREITSGSIAGQ